MVAALTAALAAAGGIVAALCLGLAAPAGVAAAALADVLACAAVALAVLGLATECPARAHQPGSPRPDQPTAPMRRGVRSWERDTLDELDWVRWEREVFGPPAPGDGRGGE